LQAFIGFWNGRCFSVTDHALKISWIKFRIQASCHTYQMTVHRVPQRAKLPGCPTWLLIAAWFCANSPQSVTYDLILWAHGATHFSHQDRLKADVAFLLAGKKTPLAVQWQKSAPTKPFAPPMPAEGLLKKIDLYAPLEIGSLSPHLADLKFIAETDRKPDRARSEPLLPPPRRAATV
jgi:hypothetical protein